MVLTHTSISHLNSSLVFIQKKFIYPYMSLRHIYLIIFTFIYTYIFLSHCFNSLFKLSFMSSNISSIIFFIYIFVYGTTFVFVKSRKNYSPPNTSSFSIMFFSRLSFSILYLDSIYSFIFSKQCLVFIFLKHINN